MPNGTKKLIMIRMIQSVLSLNSLSDFLETSTKHAIVSQIEKILKIILKQKIAIQINVNSDKKITAPDSCIINYKSLVD